MFYTITPNSPQTAGFVGRGCKWARFSITSSLSITLNSILPLTWFAGMVKRTLFSDGLSRCHFNNGLWATAKPTNPSLVKNLIKDYQDSLSRSVNSSVPNCWPHLMVSKVWFLPPTFPPGNPTRRREDHIEDQVIASNQNQSEARQKSELSGSRTQCQSRIDQVRKI